MLRELFKEIHIVLGFVIDINIPHRLSQKQLVVFNSPSQLAAFQLIVGISHSLNRYCGDLSAKGPHTSSFVIANS